MPEAIASSLLPRLRELALLRGERDEVAELLSDSTRVSPEVEGKVVHMQRGAQPSLSAPGCKYNSFQIPVWGYKNVFWVRLTQISSCHHAVCSDVPPPHSRRSLLRSMAWTGSQLGKKPQPPKRMKASPSPPK